MGELYTRESQGEGESPMCILLVFIEHLPCASPQSLAWVPPRAAWEAFWVCFRKISSLLHRRLGPGHLLRLIGVYLLCHRWQPQPALQWARRSWHECYVPFGTGPLGPSAGELMDSLLHKQPAGHSHLGIPLLPLLPPLAELESNEMSSTPLIHQSEPGTERGSDHPEITGG